MGKFVSILCGDLAPTAAAYAKFLTSLAHEMRLPEAVFRLAVVCVRHLLGLVNALGTTILQFSLWPLLMSETLCR